MIYPLVNYHSSWKWPFIVFVIYPLKIVFFSSSQPVSLPYRVPLQTAGRFTSRTSPGSSAPNRRCRGSVRSGWSCAPTEGSTSGHPPPESWREVEKDSPKRRKTRRIQLKLWYNVINIHKWFFYFLWGGAINMENLWKPSICPSRSLGNLEISLSFFLLTWKVNRMGGSFQQRLGKVTKPSNKKKRCTNNHVDAIHQRGKKDLGRHPTKAGVVVPEKNAWGDELMEP